MSAVVELDAELVAEIRRDVHTMAIRFPKIFFTTTAPIFALFGRSG